MRRTSRRCPGGEPTRSRRDLSLPLVACLGSADTCRGDNNPDREPDADSVPTPTPVPTPKPTPTPTPVPTPKPTPTLSCSAAQRHRQGAGLPRVHVVLAQRAHRPVGVREFTKTVSTFAVDSLKADWNEQSYLKAKSYLAYTSFSLPGLIDQLVYEGFSQAQAKYGATKAYGE